MGGSTVFVSYITIGSK